MYVGYPNLDPRDDAPDEVMFSNPEHAPSAPPLLEVPSDTFATRPSAPPLFEGGSQVDFSTLDVEPHAIAAGSFKSVFRAAWRRNGATPT